MKATALAAFEAALAAVEAGLAGLSAALRAHDAHAIETQSQTLQSALAQAMAALHSAKLNRVGAAALRQRLQLANASVAAQRQALARSAAGVQRALDVLLPSQEAQALYASDGACERPSGTGLQQA